MPSVKNSRKEGRKSQVLRDDDIQNRCNEDVPCTGATIQEIFSLFFSQTHDGVELSRGGKVIEDREHKHLITSSV